MIWALAIALGLALLLALALAVPVELTFRMRAPGAGSTARFEWLFGLVGKDVARKAAEEGEPREEEAKEPKKKARRDKRRRRRKLGALLRTRGFGRAFLRLSRRLLSCVEVHDLEGALRVGFDDPADTGLLYTVAWPTLVPVGPFASRLRLEPVFDGPTLELRASGRVRVVPIRLIPPLAAFALSGPTWRALRVLWAPRAMRRR